MKNKKILHTNPKCGTALNTKLRLAYDEVEVEEEEGW
jgi:hypothetical protein